MSILARRGLCEGQDTAPLLGGGSQQGGGDAEPPQGLAVPVPEQDDHLIPPLQVTRLGRAKRQRLATVGTILAPHIAICDNFIKMDGY